MHCNQPLWSTTLQNNFQVPSYKLPLYYPEVAGEGNVMSLTLPDGNIQYFFLPINRLDRRSIYNPHIWNSPNSSNINNEAWFIRSIFNAYPPVTSLQHLPNGYGDPFATPVSNINNNFTEGHYVQRFHNDIWTSTTDLQYIFPGSQFPWSTKGCAGVQVEIPKEEKTIFHYGTVCNRPCYCVPVKDTENENSGKLESSCDVTPMSVDEVKSENVTQCCCCDEKPSKKVKNNKHRKASNSNFCTCHLQTNSDRAKSKSDKLITTYTDQSSSCTDMKGCETQTARRKVTERNNVETEIWYPKRAKMKKNINTKHSQRTVSVCDSNCHLKGSACLSDTDPMDKI